MVCYSFFTMGQVARRSVADSRVSTIPWWTCLLNWFIVYMACNSAFIHIGISFPTHACQPWCTRMPTMMDISAARYLGRTPISCQRISGIWCSISRPLEAEAHPFGPHLCVQQNFCITRVSKMSIFISFVSAPLHSPGTLYPIQQCSPDLSQQRSALRAHIEAGWC